MSEYNPFSLKNKKILVTGASSGIGMGIAIECSRMGAQLIITGRNKERLNRTLSLLEGESHIAVIADLNKEGDMDRLVENIDKIDGLVNCAGLAIPEPFSFINEESYSTIMTTNFKSPLFLTQMLVNKRRFTKPASIVFISSINGIMVGYVGSGLYSASKGAVNAIVKGMAVELAVKNIRVNCICPGMVESNLLDSKVLTEEQLNEDRMKYPLKRYGKPEDVAYAAIYLLSGASAWMTGSNLLIDGGFTLL